MGTAEATEVFFAMTKLFQSRDVILRRLVYLGIKELSLVADDVIIVTSSLTKDMTGSYLLNIRKYDKYTYVDAHIFS